MSIAVQRLRAERQKDGWVLAGGGFDGLELVNDFLGYLADRNYAALTVRAYALDLLHFARWMVGEDARVEDVDTDLLLRYLAACRSQVLAHQHGGNVFSIRDGRNVGYAPRTVNRTARRRRHPGRPWPAHPDVRQTALICSLKRARTRFTTLKI